MRIAFILGCARSGTSILGELIGAHPDVTYKHEADSVWSKAGPGESASDRLTAEHVTPLVAGKIRHRFESAKGSSALFVEKSPRNSLRVPFIRAIFPEAKLIHVVRDGRDVACSMLPGIGGAEWRHLRPPSWRRLMAEDTGVIRCAKAWLEVMQFALRDLEGTPHLLVKYEDLVTDPKAVAARVLAYLELPPHPAVTAFCDQIQDETADSYQPEKQRKWYRDDHPFRIGRWRANLSVHDADVVEQTLRPMLARLGYVIDARAAFGGPKRPVIGATVQQLRSDPVIVLGVHHSGTSILAEVLHRHGVFMHANMRHFESKFFTRVVNNDIILGGGASWAKRPIMPVDEVLAKVHEVRALVAARAYRKYVRSGYDGRSRWGFKDPRTCVTLPLFLEIFPNAQLLHIVRAEDDVAESLSTSEKVGIGVQDDRDAWRDLWRQYVGRAQAYGRRHRRYFELAYEDMCDRPVEVIQDVFAYLDIPFTAAAERFVSRNIRRPSERRP